MVNKQTRTKVSLLTKWLYYISIEVREDPKLWQGDPNAEWNIYMYVYIIY